ncbi:Peptidyl-prolyl cis-trans isomerase-like 2 [Gossypium arboreum]|uniref:Peptidyl-prolyl cis-trans isomerase-like 2 n=1 Tax=Gossypium arboreum TaxID=29729 RepID=A0A0B0PTT1_GOSAR|nr:Peptidyl-prolyl cis-trans isomerase-like 2 [Gossypium arboreum]
MGQFSNAGHTDITVRTCENFVTHCDCGYYNGVAFNRNIQYGDNCAAQILSFVITWLNRLTQANEVIPTVSAMEKVPVDENDQPLEEEEGAGEAEKGKGENTAEDEDNDKVGP